MGRSTTRLLVIGAALGLIALAGGLVLFGLRGSISLFKTPSELAAVPAGTRLRIGGLIKEGSVQKAGAGRTTFSITDGVNSVSVSYQGALPDLFREGQGVVAEGVLEAPASLRADTVLAKHDERYMPQEVVDSLKKQGLWQGSTIDHAQSGPAPMSNP
jgi:cytochrome c-type biogenesis protein CcmE